MTHPTTRRRFTLNLTLAIVGAYLGWAVVIWGLFTIAGCVR